MPNYIESVEEYDSYQEYIEEIKTRRGLNYNSSYDYNTIAIRYARRHKKKIPFEYLYSNSNNLSEDDNDVQINLEDLLPVNHDIPPINYQHQDYLNPNPIRYRINPQNGLSPLNLPLPEPHYELLSPDSSEEYSSQEDI